MLWKATAPRMVFFAITSHCDLSCTTCQFPQIPIDERKHVDYDASRKAIDMLAENDVRLISITGGEPLTHPRFLDICRHIDSKGLMISYVATNGLLLDDRIARELSGLNINIVGLSMDIMDDDGFGRTRSYNVRNVVRRAKKALDDHGIKCYAGVLPGRSPEDVGLLLDQCRDLGFSKVIFSYPQCRMSSSYRAAAKSADTDINHHQMREVVHAIKEEKRSNAKLNVFNTDVNLDEFLKIHGGEQPSYVCPAGDRQFYMDWNLDLYRCFNDNVLFGNLLDIGDLSFNCENCHKCTQQAFWDYASFYRAYDFLDGLRRGLVTGDGKSVSVLLSDRDNYRAVHSLIEAYLGGFV
jgi:MoaA/NifB/PqqE/SkfB family radical SAM enzyme